LVLADVLIAELEINDDFTVDVASLELTLEDTIHVCESSSAVEFTVVEFSFIAKSWLRAPFVEALATELSIFEKSTIVVIIMKLQLTVPMEDICQELSLVYNLLSVFTQPGHLALALHL
jgi:hypothetical protein